MTLSFTASTTEDQLRHFSCQLPELEIALDVLSSITLKGDKILKAYISDEDGSMELPTEAFDGEPFTDPLHQLAEQWQIALGESIVLVSPDNRWYIELTRRRIKLYDDRIGQLLLTITKLEQFRERVHGSITQGPREIKIINHYDSLLITYLHQVDQVKNGRQLAQEKLSYLLG
ncbi:hypothetical protein GCM10028808_42120 [Spirosoma migulaei]